jgi:hypothetical protein
VANEDFGFDDLVQADKPTDENGVTTAKLKSQPTARPHESAIYATDVTDFVDLGQVAHVRFPDVKENFFASPCTDGFDPNLITVEPLPMVAGHPLTLKVKLENRQKSDVELNATFQATDWNIGANTWKDVGRVNNIHLKPGESRDVSIQWTPTAEQVHQCFRVQLKGGTKSASSGLHVLTASFQPGATLFAVLAASDAADNGGGSVQRNVGPVSSCRFSPPPPGIGAPYQDMTEPLKAALRDLATGCKPHGRQKRFCADWLPTRNNSIMAQNFIDAVDPDVKQAFENQAKEDMRDAAALLQCVIDPASSSYQRVAPSPSDDAAGYIQALTRTMERSAGAEADGDRDSLARQETALRLYEKRLAEVLEQRGADLEKEAAQLPPDDEGKLRSQQARRSAFVMRLRNGGELTADESSLLHETGFSDTDIKEFVLRVRRQKPAPAVSARAALLEKANLSKQAAREAQRLAADSPESATGSGQQQYQQPFDLSNPHDRAEDVRLMIEPLSIPSAWKLSVVNAEQVGTAPPATAAGGEKSPDPPQPEFPVREVKPGKEYVVTLPAKRQIKVASVLVPVGDIGANTTARWAVEGRIGGEVIGTMVHEMNVPYIIADMKLPAVGSKEQVEDVAAVLAAPRRSLLSIPFLIAIFAGIVVLIILFVVVSRRRRHTGNA